MWQTDWAEKPRQTADVEMTSQVSTLSPANVRSVYLLLWSEHCIECTVPECYKVCPLYVPRRDRNCARFKNGISPNPQYPGLFPFGAEVEFRRWAKLESKFGFGSVKPRQARVLDQIDRGVLGWIRPVSSPLLRLSRRLRLNGAYAILRERLLQRLTRARRETFDEFVIEAWNLKSQPVRLVVESWQQGPRFRTSILLEPGKTMQRIPAAAMNVDLYGEFGMVRVYPENDAEAHVVFSWLDFVQYGVPQKQEAVTGFSGVVARNAHPSAGKVKCVIWDLDQTAWEGVLAEQDAGKISLRPDVLRTMLALDERGILQSISSKNDHDNAWQALDRLGIAHLFLSPQINWEPKSVNIRRIVTSLNIGMDSCLFIDDSPFERAEVAHELPEIRVMADSEVSRLLELPEVDVPVTAESKQRRAFYTSESQRKEQAREYGGGYDAFLKSCKMEAVLANPTESEQVERCLELLHRSNQLNLTIHRYSGAEFTQLLKERGVMCVCTSCRDRFGDYGIVGFASVSMVNDEIVLKDFVLSCRVAQKKVENAWFKWLAHSASAAGYRKICARYVKTSRNGVLLNALLEVGFVETGKNDAGSMLELDCSVTPPASDIVSIVTGTSKLQALVLSAISAHELDRDEIERSQQAAS
jgi:FkbH-like protein